MKMEECTDDNLRKSLNLSFKFRFSSKLFITQGIGLDDKIMHRTKERIRHASSCRHAIRRHLKNDYEIKIE